MDGNVYLQRGGLLMSWLLHAHLAVHLSEPSRSPPTIYAMPTGGLLVGGKLDEIVEDLIRDRVLAEVIDQTKLRDDASALAHGGYG